MSANKVYESHREVTVVLDDQLERVDQDHCELHNLKDWQESFPPFQVLLGFGNCRHKHEITIDHNVNKLEEKNRVNGKDFSFTR